MSKSIYEEAIDDLTILLYDVFDDTPNNPRLNVTDTLDKFTKVRDTLKQAQKQEKLLTLYREKEKHEQEFPALNYIEYEDYQKIKTKIKELEK